MKVDGGLGWELDKVGEQARELEELGYSGILSSETGHDPFMPLAFAAQATSKVDLITAIAVAFARTPMVLAHVGHDLNAVSKGRFVLGLGSQIRAHITKRFSMPWSHPAARMREFILAMHAIWANWHQGEVLEFHGQFYTHSLMTPFFTPTNTKYGAPRVFLAAVGPLMTEVAGEVADGMIVHAFTTENYLRETTLPALERGFAKGGKKREDFEISYPCFVVTGRDEEELAASKNLIRQQIAFYGSTPAYKPVLESVDAGGLQGELNAMSKQGRWAEMGTLITEDMVNAFAVVGEPSEIAEQIKKRFGDVVDRTSAAYSNLPMEDRMSIVAALTAS
jgi:probable F420-dependent oxidoreductase